MGISVRIAAISLALAALFSVSTAWASTLFDTLNIPQIASEVLNGAGQDGWAQSFHTGPEDLQLDNVALKLTSAGIGTLSVGIFDGSGLTPGLLLTTLNGPSNTAGLISFVPQTRRFTLLADTTYWVVALALNEPASDPGYFWSQGTGAATTGTAVATALHAYGSWRPFKEGPTITETEPMMMQVNASARSGQPRYTVTNLEGLGGSASVATGINKLGQISGYSLTPGDAATHAVLFSNGTIIDLGTMGGTNSLALGINDNAHLVGVADTAQGIQHAFLYTNGPLLDLGTLGGPHSAAEVINNNDQIVGSSSIGSGIVPSHAVVYSNGVMHDLGTLGGTNSGAFAINDTGLITGGSDTPGTVTVHTFTFLYNGSTSSMTDLDVVTGSGLYNSEGFAINKTGDIAGFGSPGGNNTPVDPVLYSNGSVIPLASLGAFCNITMGINDHGDVVGRSASHCHGTRFPLVYGDATQRAFLNHNGAVYNLNDLTTTSGWTIYEAAAINNNGQIAGTGIFNGQYFAIRLDPETGASFYTITPCRLIDTRIQLGDANGPIQSGQYRHPLLVGNCGIPSGTTAVSLNVTIVKPSAEGFLTLGATIGNPPQTSTINFRRGQVRANNQVVGVNQDGTLAIFCGMSTTGEVDYIIDVSGYFQ